MDHHEVEKEVHDKTIFGFWIYLLTDFVMFAAIFATYIVLRTGTFGGPEPKDLFHLPFNLIETFVMLTAAFTASLAGAVAKRGSKGGAALLFIITFILGAIFLVMGLSEFSDLIQMGHTWKKSGFLSIYFTLNGTLFIHVIFALLWTILFIPPICGQGLTMHTMRRLMCLKMFWQFINVVWIFIFSLVYLLGVA